MKIRRIQLRNFKRFSDTTIADIPETARMVVLVGPNGCGKSSLIDAAQTWRNRNWDVTYHQKQIPGTQQSNWTQAITLTFYDPQPGTDDQRYKAVYARSAYRNEAEFQLGSLEHVGPALRENR